MKRFEEQIKNAAKELRDMNHRNLKVTKNPLGKKKNSWGWIATPVAAVSGIIIGIFIQGMTNIPIYSLNSLHDTIFHEKTVYDTVYLYAQDEKDTTHQNLLPSAAEGHKGKCILEDGVDYSLLATML